MRKKSIETTADLSSVVHSKLIRLCGPSCPSSSVLNKLFQMLFYASLQREEASDLLFDIVVLNPLNRDEGAPTRPIYDRPAVYSFARPIEANVANIAKLARASDRRASSFALYHDKQGAWFIWGMVDQGNQYYSFLNHAYDTGIVRPGLFQASIAGAGHIVVYADYAKLAELRIDRLVNRTHDVLRGGPVFQKLLPGIEGYISDVFSIVGKDLFNKRGHWPASLASYWRSSLCSLLLRIQSLKHGGALLLTSPDALGLNIKYQLHYDRLQESLYRRAVLHIEHTDASDKIFEEVLDSDRDEVPVEYYLDEYISASRIKDNDEEVNGALLFIACLSRVDGLIVMDNSLRVLGFGAEITIDEIPKTIIRAKSPLGGTKGGVKLDYEHFGTRHRSMI